MVLAQSSANFGKTKLAAHRLRFLLGTPTRNTVNREILESYVSLCVCVREKFLPLTGKT